MIAFWLALLVINACLFIADFITHNAWGGGWALVMIILSSLNLVLHVRNSNR